MYVRLAAGFLAFAQGDFGTAAVHVNRAMPLARDLGFTFGVTTALVALSSLAQIRGDLSGASALLDEGLVVGRAAADTLSIYHLLYWQGEIARSAGEYDRAVSLLEECLALTRQHGNAWLVATALFSLGHVELMRGDPGRAAALFREGLEARQLLHDRLGTALSVEALAWVAAATGRPKHAARLFGAADGLRQAIGASVEVGWTSDHQRFLTLARDAVDESTFEAEWTAGRDLSAEAAIELALEAGSREPRGATRGPGPLTRREREVASLIARGMTNREIAETLVIAEGTAANYVQQVLEKLGVHSRVQIAAWAVEHGLT